MATQKLLKPRDLHRYQLQTIKFALKTKRTGIFLPPGAGKTAITLTTIRQLETRKVLILTPIRVANSVWTNECRKWSHLRSLLSEMSICTGQVAARTRAIHAKPINIINHDKVPWLIENIKWKWDVVVVDESTMYKSHKAKRFKMLAQMIFRAKYVFILSGTPVANGYEGLWSQIYLLDAGDALGRFITHYRNRFFKEISIPGMMFSKYRLKAGAEKDIWRRISHQVVSLTDRDITLPKVQHIDRTFKFNDHVRKRYDKFDRDLITKLTSGEKYKAKSVTTELNGLKQMCHGAVYTNRANMEFGLMHRMKLDVLKEIRDKISEPIICFYQFEHDVVRIKEEHKDAIRMDKRPETIDKWNRGEIPMLLMHPMSGGHGLNLQDGGHIIVWFGIPWSLEHWEQGNGRLARQGQTRRVQIYTIRAEDSIEDAMMKILINRKASLREFLRAMVKRGDHVKN